MEIRKASMDDYEAMCAILSEGDALHSAHLPDRFCPPAAHQVARTREYISSLIDDPDTSVYLAEEAGQITGVIITIVRDTLAIPILTRRRVANIDIIVVSHDQQGRGIGRALMAQAEQWARVRGAHDIELTVYFFNQKAMRFYTELGYEGLSQKMVKKL
jgi:GNAT superfamily N-acetyltransferase